MTEADWQPISTAPKDGTTFLAYFPEAVTIDRLYCWPEGYKFNIHLCRWKVPDQQTHEGPGWFIAAFDVSFGVYDDPSTDIDSLSVDPTHWQPLPPPPQAPHA